MNESRPMSTPASAHARQAVPKPRVPRIGFGRLPKAWLAGSPAATAISNGVNLLFPAGERFFVRSVRHYMDRIEDPQLRAQVRGFFGQEGRHAQAHERFFDVLREQGYPVDDILARYEKLAFDGLEKVMPAAVSLSVTVALEHFTAILAEDALAHDGLALTHPAVRQLLEWHAVEELEHKAVAFDVLAAVHPSYALRMIGLLIAAGGLSAFWIKMTRELLAHDGLTLRDAAAELRRLREKAEAAGNTQLQKSIFARVFVRGIREYIRPGFHPHDKDHAAIIAEALRRLEGEGVLAKEAA